MGLKYFLIFGLSLFITSCAIKVASGDFRELSPNSLRQLNIEGLDDFDNAHGTILQYYENGKLQKEIPLDHGQIEGLALGYFPDENSTGNLESIHEISASNELKNSIDEIQSVKYAFIVSDNNHSLNEARTKTNSIEQEAWYYKNKLHGRYLLRYRNGQHQVSEFYQRSKKEGFRREYFPSGAPKSITTYLGDRKEHLFEQYRENGDVEMQLIYQNGIPLRLTTYYPRGLVFTNIVYLEGKINRANYYNQEGQLLAKMQDEVFTKYYEDGMIHYVITLNLFKDTKTSDKQVVEYDKKGNIKQIIFSQYTKNTKYPIIRKTYYQDGKLKSHAFAEKAKFDAIESLVIMLISSEHLYEVAIIENYLKTPPEEVEFIFITKGKETIFNHDGSVQEELVY